MDLIVPTNHTMSSPERHQEQDVPNQTEHQASSLVEAALNYAHNGWPVFPLHGKMPNKDFHWREEATTDPIRIEILWREHPTANIGLATGETSGVIVLDMDPRNGGYVSFK